MNTGDSAYLDISASAYFAVETLVRLVASSADRPRTAESLAQSIARSVSYTEGLLADLSDAGLVQTAQDPGGGYYLARPADRITVAEIFCVFDEPDASDRQPGRLSTLLYADINALRGTDLLLEALSSYVYQFLEGVSLADIAPATNGEIPTDDANDTLALTA